MMHGRGKSDEAHSSCEAGEQGKAICCGVGGAKGRGQGNARHQSMLRTLCRVQHVTRDGRMRIIVYLMMRSDPR
jgi:hypothetical protein